MSKVKDNENKLMKQEEELQCPVVRFIPSPSEKLISPVQHLRNDVVMRMSQDKPLDESAVIQTQPALPKEKPPVNLQNQSLQMTKVDRGNYRTGAFIYEDGTLNVITESGKLIYLGNFRIQIISEKVLRTEIVNEQNEVMRIEEKTYWRIWIFCAKRCYNAELETGDLFNSTKLLKFAHGRMHLDNGAEAQKYFKRYMNHLICTEKYGTDICYSRTGWVNIEGHGWTYLTSSGNVGDVGIQCRADVSQKFLYLPQLVGTDQIFKEFYGLRNLCRAEKRRNSVFLTHYAVLAVLVSLYRECGFPVNFVTAIIGSTNSLKTSAAMIYAKLFDRTSKATPDIRFDSTETAIRERMETLADSMLFVDDLLPYDNCAQSKEQQKKLEAIIRSYGDGVPKKRSKLYAQINNVSEYSRILGCCLITGEVLQTNSPSSDTRLIKLRFESQDVDRNMLTQYQNELLGYTTFFYDFLMFIQANIPWVFATIKKEVIYWRSKAEGMIATPRFKNTFGILAAETNLFYTYAEQRKFLSRDEANSARMEDLQMIFEIIHENENENKMEDIATVMCLVLRQAIQRKTLTCISEDEAKKIAEHGAEYDGMIINMEEYFGITPDTIWSLYRLFCKSRNQNLQYRTEIELSTPLKNAGLLLEKMEGKTKRVSHKLFAKTNQRFRLVRKSVMNELCENYESFL